MNNLIIGLVFVCTSLGMVIWTYNRLRRVSPKPEILTPSQESLYNFILKNQNNKIYRVDYDSCYLQIHENLFIQLTKNKENLNTVRFFYNEINENGRYLNENNEKFNIKYYNKNEDYSLQLSELLVQILDRNMKESQNNWKKEQEEILRKAQEEKEKVANEFNSHLSSIINQSENNDYLLKVL